MTGGVTAAVFLSAGVLLQRQGKHIPERIDRGFQVFAMVLFIAIIINLIVQLLR
jgi:hypothetical protein